MPLHSAEALALASSAVLLCPEGTTRGRTEEGGWDYSQGVTAESVRA